MYASPRPTLLNGQNIRRSAPGCSRTRVNRAGWPGSGAAVVPSQQRTAKSRGPYRAVSPFHRARLVATCGSAAVAVDMADGPRDAFTHDDQCPKCYRRPSQRQANSSDLDPVGVHVARAVGISGGVLAPEGRKPVAHGVSRGNRSPNEIEPRRGERLLSPLRGYQPILLTNPTAG